MSAPTRLEPLAERKRLILLRSDLQRAILRAECVQLRDRFSWVQEAGDKWRSASPLIAAVTALAGFASLHWGRRWLQWVPAAVAAWKWFQKSKQDPRP